MITSVWRKRPYRLNFYGTDERLVLTIPLTEEQAALIGERCLTPVADEDGFGEISLDDVVFMEAASE